MFVNITRVGKTDACQNNSNYNTDTSPGMISVVVVELVVVCVVVHVVVHVVVCVVVHVVVCVVVVMVIQHESKNSYQTFVFIFTEDLVISKNSSSFAQTINVVFAK